MNAYLDSSALIKLYVSEPESRRVAEFVSDLTVALPFSFLHELEMTNAIQLKAFRKEIPRTKARAALRLIDGDVESGLLQRPTLDWDALFRDSTALSIRNSCTLGCRSLDILHVSCALMLGCVQFITYDTRQAALARRAGLKIITP